ncbi:SIMPL domain-containing protein [Tabrizicola oligotrophica]|uniref:SIMPL domain-containing protein n=1 Tax=Tabrizicola oligotrophica TaxID=2710650 RepID=A0A6M0QPY4_9RHOB|nr:SIMPL domain-containing protein [Tabrizicola oligotrophica]NEY89406.1 SIMPL domain-containing protein [Tabrizicola oligotrophica]
MRAFQILALSTALALPLAAPALAEATITVTGEASIAATPDMATVSLGVTTEGATAAEAMAANSKALAAVIERLQGAGIAETDLQTANLSLNPNWTGYDSGAAPQIANYMAMNMLNVRVRDLANLGSVLDASIADGANTLNGITFELAAPRPVQDEARRAAMGDATAKATLYAEAAGVTLGKIASIAEVQNYGGPMPVFMEAKAASPVPVAAGQIALQAQVTVTYEIAE